jgi:Flp pilus assembly pilin Flp
MKPLLLHFIVDENGQDLVEYALLCTVIGFAGAAAFQLIMAAIGTTYGTWDNQVNNLWNTPDPAGGGS